MGRKPILTNRFDYIGKDSDAFSVFRNIINNINNCKAEISREKSAACASTWLVRLMFQAFQAAILAKVIVKARIILNSLKTYC